MFSRTPIAVPLSPRLCLCRHHRSPQRPRRSPVRQRRRRKGYLPGRRYLAEVAAMPAVTPDLPKARPTRKPGLFRRAMGAVIPGKTSAPDPRRSAAPTKQDLKLREKTRQGPARPDSQKTRPVARIISRAGQANPGKFADILLAGIGEPKLPDEVFGRLHWGGGVLPMSGRTKKSVRNLAEAYDNKRGFRLEQSVQPLHAGVRLPGMRSTGYCFTRTQTPTAPARRHDRTIHLPRRTLTVCQIVGYARRLPRHQARPDLPQHGLALATKIPRCRYP